MEFYLIRRKELSETKKVATVVSKITGKSKLYHMIDYLYSFIFYGCGPKQYVEGGFFKLRSFDRNITYTKKRRDKIKAYFNDKRYLHICTKKVDFNRYFSDIISRDWIYCKEANEDDIISFVKRHDRIIIKPIGLTKGQGVYELDKSLSMNEIVQSVIKKDLLMEEFIIQHPLMCYENKSVNTLRITTVLDHSGDVHVIKSSFRCGVGDSIVDNYCAGGVVYPVNMEFGRIEGPGGNIALGQSVYVHPGTDIFMLGREIPFMKDAIQLVKKSAKKLPQLRFVGWDVAITEKGPELIEGNTLPGEQLIEFQGSEKGFYRKIMSYL